MKTIFVKEFSEFPGPRYRSLGPYSGQDFREEVLVPAIREVGAENISINLDGTYGYGSSFLEEAFGGLLREKVINKAEAASLAGNLVSEEDPSLIEEIQTYLEEASAQDSE